MRTPLIELTGKEKNIFSMEQVLWKAFVTTKELLAKDAMLTYPILKMFYIRAQVIYSWVRLFLKKTFR